MGSKLITFFIILQLVIRVPQLNAQELFFKVPPIFQNIPSPETYFTFQDSKGFIWICTDAGICRYDGNELNIFTTKDGLPENVILSAYEDTKGRIWFSTLSSNFFYYSEGKFHTIKANKKLKFYSQGFHSYSFFIGENDTLYTSMIRQVGLLKIPPQGNYENVIIDTTKCENFHRLFFINKLNSSQSILTSGSKFIHRNDTSYTILLNGIPRTLPISTKDYPGSANIWRVNVGKDGTIYLPFGGELLIIKKNDPNIIRLRFPREIISLYIDKENDLYVTVDKNGAYLYKNSNVDLTPVRFLSSLSVTSVNKDREGSIWATTLERGVLKCNSKNVFYIANPDHQVSYFQKTPAALHISYLSKKIISVFKNDSLYHNHEIEDMNGRNMVCFYDDSAYSYYNIDAACYYKKNKEEKMYSKLNIPIYTKDVIKIENDTLLAMNAHEINWIHKNKAGTYIRYQTSINCMTKLKNGTILLGSRGNEGFFKLINRRLVPYEPGIPEFQTRINYILEDVFGNIWIATNDKGLMCYDHKKNIHLYNDQNGLSTPKVNALTFDRKNNIWAATNTGIFKINYMADLKNVTFTNYDLSHGLPNLAIEKITEFDGKIYCSTKENLFYFNSDSLKKNTTAPLSYIKSVLVNEQQVPLQDTIITSYDKNNFHIIPSIVSFKDLQKKEYLYKLIGYDKNWHYSNISEIHYTNLDHGTYTLIIYGLNNDKLKSNKAASIVFIIRKPFWLTWWFISLEIILVYTLFHCFFKLWKTKIEKKEQEKTMTNKKIAEFKMTALRAQMNPHFIFNAIGSIQHYILKNEVKQSYNYLSTFSMLIRNILNNSRTEYISISQEINTLRLYIELEQIRFKIPFKFILEIDDELDMETDIPTMLIQPYIENSIWHGLMPKENQGTLELLFKKQNDFLIVLIRDNGVGRNISKKDTKHISHGMSITEQRIEILASTNQKKFTTTITDLIDEQGAPLGTEVKLMIPLEYN